jgi:hypothetical protein
MTQVCRPTPFVRFMHASELALTATGVSHGTTRGARSCFSPRPYAVEREPKRDSVENVHKNYSDILLYG